MTWLQHYSIEGEPRGLQLVDDRHWTNDEVIISPTRLVVCRGGKEETYPASKYKYHKIGEVVHIRRKR